MLTFVSVFISSLLISFIITPFVRNRALRLGLVDVPKERRHIHTNPIARAGGIAIFIAFVISLSLLLFLDNRVGLSFKAELQNLLRLMAPCFLIFLLGLVDDALGLSARSKFLVQLAAALLFYSLSARITTIGNPFTGTLIDLGWLSLPITVLWLVGIANAFNLIDGVDGLSAGSALFATLAMMCVALVNGNLMVTVLTCALAGAILGFLKYNFNPATIFMGDCGSLFIGFMLAALAIQGAQKSTTVVAIAIPLVSFGLPVLETLLSMARRFLAGESLFGADRRHIHHQLLAKGLSHRQVVILLYGVSAFFALLSLLLIDSPGRVLGLILLVFGISAWLGIQHLGYHEFGEVGRLFQRSLRQRAVMAANIQFHNSIANFANARTLGELLDILDECLQIVDFKRVEIRLSSRHFSLPEGHPRFSAKIEEGQLKLVRLNLAGKSTTPERMVELHIPLCCEQDREGLLILSRALDDVPVGFDINLLFNSLRTKLELSLTRISKQSAEAQPFVKVEL
jgi:UDP-GlcNAc:undecaprenyl-phosphate/decaprenyl-phosphate GlcNAc-1-phosphate transferase